MQLKSIPEDFIVVEVAHHDPLDEGPYALIEVTKRNLTTEKALSAIADSIGVPRRFLSYAGTKDARALTKQFVTVKIKNPGVVEKIKKFGRDNITVRFIGHVNEPLGLGNLEKNRFEIVVRNIQNEKIHPMKKIPNYFDEQRFSTANAQIGKLIIKNEFKKAAELVIKTDQEADARLTRYLEEKPNDAVGALKLLPKNLLLMYVHAYQSLLFNELLSEYIKSNDSRATLIEGIIPVRVPSKELGEINIPIIGFDTQDAIFSSLYETILVREEVEQRDFVVRSIPFLTVEGSYRNAFFEVEDLEISAEEPDDLHPGFRKQRLSFTLPKSCYATMVIKCLYRTGSLGK